MESLQKVLIVANRDLNILLFRRALVKSLLERGIEVHVGVPRGEHSDELLELGVMPWYIPMIRGSLNPLDVPPSFRIMRGLIAYLQPQVVHSFTHQANMLVRVAAGRHARVVHTITGLGSGFLQPGLQGLAIRSFLKLLYIATSSRCQAIVFQNEADKAYFERNLLLGRARASCIKGSGVDTERFRPDLFTRDELLAARQALGLEPEHVVCTMTARLLYDKGIMVFVHAAAMLAQACPQARFLIVGEPDRGNSRALSQADMDLLMQQPNIVLTGWRDDMPLVWCLSDVGVLPSYREGLPMSLQEAMACGLPVITTDVPGCREVVDGGSHGILVPMEDSHRLRQAMFDLIVSPERRRAMGLASREKAVQVFAGPKIASRHIELYESLLRD